MNRFKNKKWSMKHTWLVCLCDALNLLIFCWNGSLGSVDNDRDCIGVCRRLANVDVDKWFFFWFSIRINCANNCWCWVVIRLLLLFINEDVFKWERAWWWRWFVGNDEVEAVSSSGFDSHLDEHRIKRQTTHRAHKARLSGCHRRRVGRQRTVLEKLLERIRATMFWLFRVVWSNSLTCY